MKPVEDLILSVSKDEAYRSLILSVSKGEATFSGFFSILLEQPAFIKTRISCSSTLESTFPPSIDSD